MAWYKVDRFWVLLAIVVLLRFLCVLAPQTGYIHPDEFFQNVEVVAGHVLDIDTYTPWEYNGTFPLRSITLPYLLTGLPLLHLKYLTSLTDGGIPTAYFALIMPRLTMAVLSLVNDLSLFYICITLKLDAKYGWLLMSTSYVTFVYLTRTFSNSIEAVLFSVLLVVLLKSCSYVRCSKHKDKSVGDKQKLKASGADMKYCSRGLLVILGVILMCGVFNRPTFLIFAATPVFSWFCYQMLLPGNSKTDFIVSVLLWSGLGVLLTFCFFICVDTFYFNPNLVTNFHEIIEHCVIGKEKSLNICLRQFTDNLVITPWNFITYNTKSDNLKAHGLHPHYLHLLVNIPMLFGPMALGTISHVRDLIYGIYNKKVDWLNAALLSCASVPVLVLSVFPHQEARFLIPTLPLFVILSLGCKPKAKFRISFITAWLSFNLIMTVVFGFLHQGGIVPCLQHIQNRLAANSGNKIPRETTLQTEVKSFNDQEKIDKFIFYHTYMPPRHLLMCKTANLHIVDLQGASRKELRQKVSDLKKMQGTSKVISAEPVGEIFVIVPGTLMDEITASLSIKRSTQFPLHLSFEDPPDIFKVFREINDFIYLSSVGEFYDKLIKNMSLYLLQIKSK